MRRTPVDTTALNNPQLSDVLTTWDTDLLSATWMHSIAEIGEADATSASGLPSAEPADGSPDDGIVIRVDWVDAARRIQTNIARTSSAGNHWTLMPLTACLVGSDARASLKLSRLLKAEEIRRLGDEVLFLADDPAGSGDSTHDSPLTQRPASHALAYIDSFALQGLGSYSRRSSVSPLIDIDFDIIAKIAAQASSTDVSDIVRKAVAEVQQAIIAALARTADKSAGEPTGSGVRSSSLREMEELTSSEPPPDLTGEAADVVAAVEWLQTTLGVPQRDILKAANIKERTWHHWQKVPAAHPRLSSQGDLWALVQQAQVLLEELDETPANWFRRNTELRKLLRAGKFDQIIDSVLDEKLRSGVFDDPITARRRVARAASPEYHLDDEDVHAGDEPGGDHGRRRR